MGAGYDCHSVMFMHGHEVCFKAGLGWASNIGRNFCLFVLRFYGPVNPNGSCRARSVYLTTFLLGRISLLNG